MTKNQTFIFFLIPILIAFSCIYLDSFNNFVRITLALICVFAVLKYHLRFNEGRKFHELNYVDFKISSPASEVDIKLKGLKWITPEYKNNSKNEIKLINEIKLHLQNDKRKKMLITNYSFFSVILNEKLFSPSRWYLLDGTDYPLKENRHFTSYKKLLINLINKNNIEAIYTIYPLESSIIRTYFDKSCFQEIKISDMLISHELKSCYEING